MCVCVCVCVCVCGVVGWGGESDEGLLIIMPHTHTSIWQRRAPSAAAAHTARPTQGKQQWHGQHE